MLPGTFRLLCSVALCSAVLLSSAGAADDYQIKINRPEKVGAKYELNGTTHKKESSTVKMGDKVIQSRDKNVKATLTGTVEVLKVDKDGLAVKKKLTVTSFKDAEGTELLKKGTVVFAETVEGKGQYRLADGSKLESRVRGVIGDLFDTQSKSAADIEQALGTDKRRKIGESWPVKTESLAKSLHVDPKAIKGTATLEKTADVNGEKCLLFSAKMIISDFPGKEDLKKQMLEVKSVKFNMTVSGYLPIDPKKPIQSFSATMNLKAHVVGPNGIDLQMTMDNVAKKTRQVLK